MKDICPQCNEKQYSPYDKTFLNRNGRCWTCVCAEWKLNKISTEEFKKLEQESLNNSMQP